MFKLFSCSFFKSKSLKKKNGFTFIELIVGLSIMAIASVGAWMTMSILTQSTQVSRNRSIARNYLQKSLEEVRRVAQFKYDALNGCAFPTDESSVDACDFELASSEYDNFTRTLEVDDVAGSTEMKSVVVTILWNELGHEVPEELKSAIYFARPADEPPGNLIGVVTDESDDSELGGVSIFLEFVSNTAKTATAVSTNALGDDDENFDFADNGRYVLESGDWRLRATRDGYYSYTHSDNINIISSPTTFVSFAMEPEPAPGALTLQLVDKETRAPLSSFRGDGGGYGYLRIYEGGHRRVSWGNRTSGTYEVDFTDLEDRCFTVETAYAYRAGKTLFDRCEGVTHSLHGYSSARHNDDGTPYNCSNSYNGNESTDRICVGSGEDIEVALPVEPVPLVQISGRVIDYLGGAVDGASIRAYWDYSNIYTGIEAFSDASGRFSMMVPAAAAFAFRSSEREIMLRVRNSFDIEGCCDWPTSQTLTVYREYGGLVFGHPGTDVGDIQFPEPEDLECGDLAGRVFNGKSGGVISNAYVYIRGTSRYTGGDGTYAYACSEEGYRLTTGNINYCRVSKSGYYGTFYCSYNERYSSPWYMSYNGVINPGNSNPAFNVSLWPQGYGVIEGHVTDIISGSGIENLVVTFNPYRGSNLTAVTDATGYYRINGALETWPPPEVPNSGYYNMNPQGHILSVSGGAVYTAVSRNIYALNAGEIVTQNFQLNRQGGL